MLRVRFTRPLVAHDLPEKCGFLELQHALTHQTVLEPGETCRIPTGVAIEIPTGCVALIQSHPDLTVLGPDRKNALECIGQILLPRPQTGDTAADSTNRDEIHVVIRNVGLQKAYVLPTEKVGVLVVLPAFTAFEQVR